MKLILCTLIIFLGGICCNVIKDDKINVVDTTDLEATLNLKAAFNDIFKQKCDKIGGDSAYNRFMASIGSTIDCVKSHFPENNETDDSSSSEEICAYKNKHLRHCFRDVIGFLKDCSEPEEKYFPDFIFDAFDGIIDLFCVDYIQLSGLLGTPETQICLKHIEDDDEIFNVCPDKITLEIFNSETDIILTKPELCSVLKTVHECYDSYLTKKCPNDKQVKIFLKALYNAISSPCKEKPQARLLI